MFEKLIRVAACQLLSGEKVEENVSKVLNFIELCAGDNVANYFRKSRILHR
jgi:predicted amidohydrolase